MFIDLIDFISEQKNSKFQFCQSDLLKLLSYLEGELQARDVVIAALKVIIHPNFEKRTKLFHQ